MSAVHFPKDFALGAASAATQIDGDCKESNWYEWYKNGKIKDNSDPNIATDHRGHLEEDTRLMAEMGIRHYRFGLEWARLEPQEGQFPQEEIEKVREEITLLHQNGIHVLLTLHHFSNPLWFEHQGGFLGKNAVKRYLAMVEFAVRHLGDLVDEYVTINEPNVYAVCGYLGAGFPPGEFNISHALRVMKVMGECHRRAYRLIHNIHNELGYAEPKVGLAMHMRAFVPYNAKNLWHRIACRISEYNFQTKLNKTYMLGPEGPYADFLGLNYYARTATSGLGDGTLPNVPVNDLGWEIYPAGIVECCQNSTPFCRNCPFTSPKTVRPIIMMHSAVVIFMSISRFFRKVVCPSPAITTGALWITSNGWRALLPALVLCISIPILMPAPSKRAESSMPV